MGFLQRLALSILVALSSLAAGMFGSVHSTPIASPNSDIPPDSALSNGAVTSSSSPSAILSPLQIATGGGASNTPTQSVSVYHGETYNINIPAGFVFDGAVNYLPANYMSWHSTDMTEELSVEWQQYSPSSEIARDESATLLSDSQLHVQSTISHPQVRGAASSTMRETPPDSTGQSGIYLWAIGSNGNIYSVVGLASTLSGRETIKHVIETFSVTNN